MTQLGGAIDRRFQKPQIEGEGKLKLPIQIPRHRNDIQVKRITKIIIFTIYIGFGGSISASASLFIQLSSGGTSSSPSCFILKT